ncbi:hypothetical protein MA16_Dca014697 [Dendrobium catenatum]|uniref:DUF4371 domain-containing protein n=1 Tax=Dendrobium catenatum TaxID=906689 RepID=A0A2I0VIJ7_9ASPA|nr:hypothetical protein MA16_Dca014697 [Dendrobium catenatum]
MKDIDDSYFTILVDESSDIFTKEQLAITMRYVDKLGQVIEQFIGISHVSSTNVLALKTSVETVLAKQSLSIHRIHG